MSQPPVRVSILIPNYNNGRESSRGGRRDFIDDLLRSLHETLADDPTPVEILIADDGSTDDSLDTCRRWAQQTRRDGRPLCRLIEDAHTGVLSVVANRLTDEARGDICCRLDGDVVARTPRWAARIVEVFDAGPPDLGVVGPIQLLPDGRIHSAGSWVLHPRGHHHLAQGAPAGSVTVTTEVDHVMGCFYCHRREVWAQLGGYDETIRRGQTVDFGLRARLRGWRTIAVPHVEFIHAHCERDARATGADSEAGIRDALDRFEAKWGFDRLAPDLDVVAERYAGTPLLWNHRVFGPRLPWPPPVPHPADIRESEWARYAADEPFRAAVDARARLARSLRDRAPDRGRVGVVDARAGLLCHLLAGSGIGCVGVDPDERLVDLARAACAEQEYPGAAPTFAHQADRRRLPLDDGAVDALLITDVLERHPNPVGLLLEAHRVLSDGGVLAIAARARPTPFDTGDEQGHPYRFHELLLQVHGTRRFRPVTEPAAPAVPGAVTLLAERVASAPAMSAPAESRAAVVS